jgi:hypothetical protein
MSHATVVFAVPQRDATPRRGTRHYANRSLREPFTVAVIFESDLGAYGVRDAVSWHFHYRRTLRIVNEVTKNSGTPPPTQSGPMTASAVDTRPSVFG